MKHAGKAEGVETEFITLLNIEAVSIIEMKTITHKKQGLVKFGSAGRQLLLRNTNDKTGTGVYLIWSGELVG